MKLTVFDNFSRGLWMVEAEDILLPPTALLVAKNVEYFSDGEGRIRVRGRRGKIRRNTDTALPGTIHTLHRHSPRVGAPTTLVAYENGSAVNFRHDTNTDGLFEALFGSFNAQDGIEWQFVNNPTLNASYGVNGYNGLRKYDGVTLSEVTLSGGVFAATGSDIGPFLTVGQQRLWATKRESINHLIYFTDVGRDDIWRSAAISLNDPAGGTIVGIVPWRDAMLFAKTSGWWRFFGDPEFGFEVHPYSERGCIAPRTIDVTPYGVFYLASDGLRMTDGADPSGVDMSQALRPLFVTPGGQRLYPSAIGKWQQRKEQYWLKLSPTDDTLYVLQRVVTPEGPIWVWSVWTHMPCSEISVLDGALDNYMPVLGDASGKYWEGDVGTVDDDNNTLTPIPIEIQTAFVPLEAALLQYGRVVRMQAVFRSRQTLVLKIFYDSKTAVAAQATVGSSTPDYRMSYADVPVTNQGQHGQWVSIGAQLPESSYEVELYRFTLDAALRGAALRRKDAGVNL